MTTPGRSSPPPSLTACLDRLDALLSAGPPMFPPRRRIVLEAEERARRALEDGTLARAAEQQLQQVREQAVREADETRRGADLYAMTVLERLEREIARIQATVQRGKTVLSERTGGRASTGLGSTARLDNGKLASV